MTLIVEQETDDASSVRLQRGVPQLIDKGGVLVITATAAQPLDGGIHIERGTTL
jgi:hypothetical protein